MLMTDATKELLRDIDRELEQCATFIRNEGHLPTRIDKLRARIDAALEDDGWMQIETAPKDGRHILATNKNSSVGFGYFNGTQQPWECVVHWFENGFYASVYGCDQEYPFTFLTHWRELPALPKEKS